MPQPRKPRGRCLSCSAELRTPVQKFCSNDCQHEYQYQEYIRRWLAGEVSGNQDAGGVVSKYVRRWLVERDGEHCSECGWAERNPSTGIIPLHADHVDGDWKNTRPENLRFLCPNCDSLTPHYGAANRGSGRGWRRERYLSVVQAGVAQQARAPSS